MTTTLMTIIMFGALGTGIGYMIQVLSDQIVLKKCAIKNQAEQLKGFNQLIRAKQTKAAISVINGIIWAFIAFFESSSILAILISFIITLGITISIIDIRIRIIPNELILILILAGIAYQFVGFGTKSLLIGFCCMIAIMVLFILLGSIMGLDKIGAGDVKLAGAMGLVLGFPNIFVGFLMMSVLILIYSFIGFALYKISLKSVFAYAPFMMIGMTIALCISVFNIDIVSGGIY